MKKITIFIFGFLKFFVCNGQGVEVTYKQTESYNPSKYINVTIDEDFKKILESKASLEKIYKVRLSENHVVKSLDSLSQNCDAIKSKVTVYTQIEVQREGGWKRYLYLKNHTDDVLYEDKTEKVAYQWKIDFSKVKNILDYKCYYAENELNRSEHLWFTTDLPVSLSPTTQFGINGLVVEYHKGDLIIEADKVKIFESSTSEFKFDLEEYSIVPIQSQKDLRDLIKNEGDVYSTEDFLCVDK